MLFNEFVAGTGCKDTDYNYKVYKELEIIYMNTDCTKEHIYDMGKKLVDNSKSKSELEAEAEIQEEINGYKQEIIDNKTWIDYYREMVEFFEKEGETEMAESNRRMIKFCKQRNTQLRAKIKMLKTYFA